MEVRVKVHKLVYVLKDSWVECDKCRERIEKSDAYDAFECGLNLTEGAVYPGDGLLGTRKTVDLCQRCGNILFDYLEEQGYRINVQD